MQPTAPTPQDGAIDVAVIIGSTRPGRRAPRIARWLLTQLDGRDDLVADVIDLQDLDLPAALPSDDHPGAAELIRRVDRADAFIVITPEYNHGYPASLKQAIDVPYREWAAKPVAFVSYGGLSGGIRAVEQLRQVFAELRAVTIRDGVALPGINVDADGVAGDPDVAAAAKVMIDDLLWWARALRDARATCPRDGATGLLVTSPSSDGDTAEIGAILEAMAGGFNARDVATADRHFSPDAVLTAPDGRRVEGLDAIQRYHEARLAGLAHTWTTRYHVVRSTSVAPGVVIAHTAQDVDTGTGTFQNHGTFVFAKRRGTWAIVAAHNTNVVPSDDGSTPAGPALRPDQSSGGVAAGSAGVRRGRHPHG